MIVLGLLALSSFGAIEAGSYNIDELRNVMYEPELTKSLAGVDPSIDLDTLKWENVDAFRERLLAKYPKEDDPSYLFMKSKTGQRFACAIPQVTQKVEEEISESFNPKYLAEVVAASFYVKNCIQLDNGWWKYELCRGKSIRQFHGAKNEREQVENSLGMFVGRFSLPDFQKSTADRLLYFEEIYEGGTLCDLEDKKIRRRTHVRYECDPLLATSEAYMEQVEESSSCEYLIRVKVGSLCRLKPFTPPSKATALKISCQPYVSVERINTYLTEKVEENEIKEKARVRVDELRIQLNSAKRIRAAVKHTQLKREETKNEKVMAELDKMYNEVTQDYFVATYQAMNGHSPSPSTLEGLIKLAKMMDGPELANFDYDDDIEEDRGNLWYYFMDSFWNKKYYPSVLRYVHISNEYYSRVAHGFLGDYLPTAAKTNPFKFSENRLIGYKELRPVILDYYIPSFIPHSEELFDGPSLQRIADGQLGIFAGREKMVTDRFIHVTELNFLDGYEVKKEELVRTMAGHLSPVYLLVELYLSSQNRNELKRREPVEKVRELSVRMLDRLMVAYQFAEMKFDYEHEVLKVSFAGRYRGDQKQAELRKKLDFESHYGSVVKSRSPAEQKELMEKYRKAMEVSRVFFHKAAFDEIWLYLADELMHSHQNKKKAALLPSADLRKMFGSLGRSGAVVTEANEMTSETLLEMLDQAGLSKTDVKIEVVNVNDVKELEGVDVSSILESQMEELRQIQKVKDQATAYNVEFGGEKEEKEGKKEE